MESEVNPMPEHRTATSDTHLVHLIREALQPIDNLSDPPLDDFVNRVGDAQIVLLGDSTHGTAEFYELRARMSLKLIKEKPFNLVAIEADWPDVEAINNYIHGRTDSWKGFRHFPEWTWRNSSFVAFIEELRSHNLGLSERFPPVSVFGLDIFSLQTSLAIVRRFLEKRSQKAAHKAEAVEAKLHPWESDPSRYGFAVWRNEIKGAEKEVLQLLKDVYEHRFKNLGAADSELLSVLQNARVLMNAEKYYREIYERSEEAWNLRERHMFETLQLLLDHFGEGSHVIVWEHNMHISDARATDLNARKEISFGELCRSRYGKKTYLVGCMTDHGTVSAALRWGGLVQSLKVPPPRDDSYESLLHATGIPAFFLPLRNQKKELIDRLRSPRYERSIGIIYSPEAQSPGDYVMAKLADQFDEIVWIDETSAVTPLEPSPETEEVDTYPFGV
jgi:erythromycin esterase-like protein